MDEPEAYQNSEDFLVVFRYERPSLKGHDLISSTPQDRILLFRTFHFCLRNNTGLFVCHLKMVSSPIYTSFQKLTCSAKHFNQYVPVGPFYPFEKQLILLLHYWKETINFLENRRTEL